jgi:cytochrome c oxidase assembly protein subunit 15
LIIGGSFVFCGIVGGVGALAGRRAAKSEVVFPLSDARRWLARFAVVAAASALPVLLSGGLVTSTGAGLAVPDWPTSYSANMFLYPLSKMTGGIYYEHAHRLFGSLVGLTTLTLLVFVLIAEPRRWVKGLGGFAFLFVCVQGYLGGVRVTSADAVAPDTLADNQGSLVLAMVHGVTGQLFFATLCVLAAVLGAGWITFDRREAKADRGLRALSGLLLGGLVVQLAMGSAARHMNHPHALWAHVGFAVIVLVLAALAAFRAMGRHRALDSVRRLGHAVIHTVGLQVVLGVITLMLVLPYQTGKVDPPAAVLLATAHQATGAILIGASAMLGAWALLVNTSGQPGKRFSRAPDGSL